MQILKSLFIATFYLSVSAHAALLDNRSSPNTAQMDVTYKNVQVDDLVAGIVPSSYAVEYASPTARSSKVSVSGKGAWNSLLDQGLSGAGLRSNINQSARTVRIEPIAAVLPVTPVVVTANPVLPPIIVTTPGSVPSLPRPTAALPASLAPASDVYVVKSSDGSVSRVVLRWAAQADMQLVWEPIDVDYPVQAENVWGNDVRAALGGLFGSLTNAQTALRACIHPNKPRPVIRVIRAGMSCKETGGAV
jgi:hypothetical protein